jgi:5'-nucleotidase
LRILLTNDDGIDALGLEALETALSVRHEVWVCAPDGERSGTSHSIQVRGPVRIRKVSERRFVCGGSPADCVFLSRRGSFIPPYDAVVSGINRGPNLGTDILYSGTCAAARQAVLLGVPSLAVSLATLQAPWDYGPGAELVARSLEWFLSLAPADHFLNLNLPAVPASPLEARPASLCVRRYLDKVVEFTAPDGDLWCWVEGRLPGDSIEPGSDWDLVNRGWAAYTALPAQPSANLGSLS